MPEGLELGKKYVVMSYGGGDIGGTCQKIIEDLNGCQHAVLHMMGSPVLDLGVGQREPRQMEAMDLELADETGEAVTRGPSLAEGRLGKKYRDAITGFEGIAVRRALYPGNGVQLTLQPPYDYKEHKMPDRYSFDEQQLVEITDTGEERAVPTRATGGPDYRASRHIPG